MKRTAKQAANNRLTLIVSAAIGLVLAYMLASRALDTGSYWQYLGCLVFIGLSIRLLVRAIKK